jgi:hypothetical protein
LISRKVAITILIVVTVLMAAAVSMLPRIPQPQSYHHFADARVLLGIPNFNDVISNLPFAVIGIWGMVCVLRSGPGQRSCQFVEPAERWPYLMVFGGLLLTAVGSSYYHLHPNNTTLVWDRLPMTVVFMALVAAVIAERINVRLGVSLLPFLLLAGITSVLQWYFSEVRGAGDLRFYAFLQVYSALVLLIALLFPARYSRSSDFAIVVGFYALAKVLETSDKDIFRVGHVVSGHTLKHLAAAMAGYWILRMIRLRQPISTPTQVLAAQQT